MPTTTSAQRTRPRTVEAIQSWIRAWIGERASLPRSVIDRTVTLEELGLGSAEQLQLVHDLGRHLDIDIPATTTWDTGTIANFAAFAFKTQGEGR